MLDLREIVAAAMWHAEVARIGPASVAKGRTPDQFAQQLPETRERWLYLAEVAINTIIREEGQAVT